MKHKIQHTSIRLQYIIRFEILCNCIGTYDQNLYNDITKYVTFNYFLITILDSKQSYINPISLQYNML